MMKAMSIIKGCFIATIFLLLALACNMASPLLPFAPIQSFLGEVSAWLNQNSPILFCLLFVLLFLWLLVGFACRRQKENELEESVETLEKTWDTDSAELAAEIQNNDRQCNELKCRLEAAKWQIPHSIDELNSKTTKILYQTQRTLEHQQKSVYLSNQKLYSIAKEASTQTNQELSELITQCSTAKYL